MARSKRGLDYWVGEEDAQRFRERRQRGTRAPISLGLVLQRGVWIPLIWPISFGAMWIQAESGAAKVAGLLAVASGVLVAGLYIRYLRKPIDPEFLPTKPWWRRS